MKKQFGSILCAVWLVGCETAPRVEALKRRNGGVSAFNRFVFNDRFSFTDSVHTHIEIPETNIGTGSTTIAGSFGNETVEGSLDILGATHTNPSPIPEYQLLFLRYEKFKHGGQQSSRVGGIENVVTNLAKLRLPVEVIMKVVGQLLEKQSVSIPNILMPVENLAAYGY
jgi:hypothetical protein